MSNPHLMSWMINLSNVDVYIYILNILAIDYLCNHVRTIRNIVTLDYFPAWACYDGEERHLGEVTGAWTFTVQGLQVVKTNQAIYWTQKAADSWIGYGLFIMRSDFSTHPLFDKELCMTSQAVFRECQQEARLNTASTDMHYLYAVPGNKATQVLELAKWCCSVLPTQAHPTMFHSYTSSYIPQTKQHEPKEQMLFCLGNVINFVDVHLATTATPMITSACTSL